MLEGPGSLNLKAPEKKVVTKPVKKEEEKKQPAKVKKDLEQEPIYYKTILCKWFEQYGKCTFPTCSFAHGQKELRSFKEPIK